MNDRGQLAPLKKKALAGKPGYHTAFIALSEILISEPQKTDELLPIIFRFFAVHPPPTPVSDTNMAPDALKGSEAYAAFQVMNVIFLSAQREGGRLVNSYIGKSSAEILSWINFILRSCVEPDLRVDGSWHKFPAQSMFQTLLVHLHWLLLGDIIAFDAVKNCASVRAMIISAHLYGLFIDDIPGWQGSTGLSRQEVCQLSAEILNWALSKWDRSWKEIYRQQVGNLPPCLTSAIARLLSRLVQEQSLHYPLLHYWLWTLAQAAHSSENFSRQLSSHRSIYFANHLVCRVSKDMASLDSHLLDSSIIRTWRHALQFLYHLLDYFAYDNIVPTLKSGLLQALWRVSRIIMHHPHLEELQFLNEVLLGHILGLIYKWSLYPSVQKPLEILLQRSPLNKIAECSVTSENGVERRWVQFARQIKARIALRCRWEEVLVFCSNQELCKSPPKTKLYRCSRCTAVSYCSFLCQKMHWERTHRKECCKRVAESQNQTSRQRDEHLAFSMVKSELWCIRSDLLRLQREHRRSSPSRSVTSQGVLVSCVDFTTSAECPEYRVCPVDEARAFLTNPTHDWDQKLRSLRALRKRGELIGPIVIAKIPSNKYYSLVLTRPQAIKAGELIEKEDILDGDLPDEEVMNSMDSSKRDPSLWSYYKMGSQSFHRDATLPPLMTHNGFRTESC